MIGLNILGKYISDYLYICIVFHITPLDIEGCCRSLVFLPLPSAFFDLCSIQLCPLPPSPIHMSTDLPALSVPYISDHNLDSSPPAPGHKGRIPMDILRLYPCLFSFLFVFPFAVVPGHLDLVLLLFSAVLDMLPQAAGVSVSLLTSKHLTPVWLL